MKQNDDMNFGTVPVIVPPELRHPDFLDFSEVPTERLEEMVRQDLETLQKGSELVEEAILQQVLEELARRKPQPEGQAAAAWENFKKFYAPASMKTEGHSPG